MNKFYPPSGSDKVPLRNIKIDLHGDRRKLLFFEFCKNHRKKQKMLLQTRNFVNFLTRYRSIWYNKRIRRKLVSFSPAGTFGKTAGIHSKNRKGLDEHGIDINRKDPDSPSGRARTEKRHRNRDSH